MPDDRELKAMATVLGAMEALDPDERARVLAWLAARFGVAPQQSAPDLRIGAGSGPSVLGNLKEFLKAKNPKSDVARVTALAYHLNHQAGQSTFKIPDLVKARTDAALPTFNVSRAISNSQRAGYLTTAGSQGSYQITSTGEALVDAMPDEDAVKQVMSQGTRRRRKPPAIARATSSERKA